MEILKQDEQDNRIARHDIQKRTGHRKQTSREHAVVATYQRNRECTENAKWGAADGRSTYFR